MGAKMDSLREIVYARDGYTCQRCGKSGVDLTIHHKIPKARGGKNVEDNLVTWCTNCHRRFHIIYGIDY